MTRSNGFGLSGKGGGTLQAARPLGLFALLACAFGLLGGQAGSARSAELEKDQLKFGFIKLTDMAPLAIANEKLFFEDEGLQVLLEAGTIHGQINQSAPPSRVSPYRRLLAL